MKKIFNKVIEKGSAFNRDKLLDLNNSGSQYFIGKGVNVVYVYSLVDNSVNYPNGKGKTIYVGEAGRLKENTGKRFGQHISTQANKGGDRGSNYTISTYYWNGNKIKLTIYKVDDDKDRKDIEKSIIQAHVKKYGARPIAQGCSGKNYTTDVLNQTNFQNEYKYI